MALSTAVISFDVADMLGEDFDPRRTKAWTSTNVENDTLIDTTANLIRIGDGKATIGSDGTGEFGVWAPGAGANPASWQTYFHFDYVQPGSRERKIRTFGPYTLTGSANLADLEQEQAIPPTYLGEVTGALTVFVDDAEAAATAAAASAAAAHDISNIATTDDAMTAVASDPDSDFAAQQLASIAAALGDVTDPENVAGLLTEQAAEAAVAEVIPGAVTGQLARQVPSGTLPVVSITTAALAPIVSKDVYLTATVSITGAGDVPDYAGVVQVKGRGNATWLLDKKPYKIKAAAAFSPLGLPADKEFVLLANRYDPALINNALAMSLGAASTAIGWAPRFRAVELVLNGVYQGVYQLMESVAFGPNRVPYTKASGSTGLASTGAYLLEIDQRLEENSETGFRTTIQNIPVIFDDPSGSNTAQFAYVHGFVQAFEDALYNQPLDDHTNGYRRYLDVESWAAWYVLEEFASNQDSNSFASCKMVKTRDTAQTPGVLRMGPLWDFDISFGNAVAGSGDHPSNGFYTKTNSAWFIRLLDDPYYVERVRLQWGRLRAQMVTTSDVNALVDTLIAKIATAALKDQARWDYDAPWAEQAAAKKQWIGERIAWMDSVFPPMTNSVYPAAFPIVLAA